MTKKLNALASACKNVQKKHFDSKNGPITEQSQLLLIESKKERKIHVLVY